MRGTVVPLIGSERLKRMQYLAGLATIDQLDTHVRRWWSADNGGYEAPKVCPDIYYLLTGHNGGKDPTAPDPADRWSKKGKTFVNITCDCIGGMAWCGGWDRYQPVRFSHIYGGWINTDSMRMDAAGPAKCFRLIDTPEPGCYVVYKSGALGRKKGHIGGILELPAGGIDYKDRDWWRALKVVDVAKRDPHHANQLSTGLAWWNTDAWFVEPIMMP